MTRGQNQTATTWLQVLLATMINRVQNSLPCEMPLGCLRQAESKCQPLYSQPLYSHGGTPSRRDKYVTVAAISPPGAARCRFFGGHQPVVAGCKPPPLPTYLPTYL